MNSLRTDDTRDSWLRWHQFLIATAAFLVYETMVLIVFQEAFNQATFASAFGFWFLLAAAAAGYLLYGMFSGSVASVLILAIPIVIALAIDGTVADNDQTGEALPLFAVWIYYSIFFFPAWFLGLFVSMSANDDDGGET